ncbi:MAG: protein translocase subunit SecA 2 [Gemmatales bacterium]|nr:MAG: protein translocase subunit SecA 2 [Gemmatales bacterium]
MPTTADRPIIGVAVGRETRPANRMGSRWWNWLKSLVGLPSQRRLARAALRIDAVRYWEDEFLRLADDAIRQKGIRLRGRLRGGETLDQLLPEVFGAVCALAQRHLHVRLFDVQIAAGVVLHEGGLAELATGEGKTFVAMLPAALNALVGKGVHVTTVNDYLARRDADWTRPIYEALGLSVGVLQQRMEDADRQRAYEADITYGTASEFGFDFLRDRLKIRSGLVEQGDVLAPWSGDSCQSSRRSPLVQRGHYFALVDEADNIFIDEARTPLIIANAPGPASAAEQMVFRWADAVARECVRNVHFFYDEKKQTIHLTHEGLQKLRWSNPPMGPNTPAMDKLREHLEHALYAHYRFHRDQHYLIENDKVEIIDEFTGRRMPDRHWREGLHQAVEAKEGVPITKPSEHVAQITFQSYFKQYERLCGMTGTAAQNWRELRRVYGLCVVCVPTNRPVIREHWPDRVFANEEKKFAAVVEEVRRLTALGRPVLIGTRSVEKSEKLSERLREAGIEHQVLNARNHENEARIIAEAGQARRVTIATNMAGRGTDIKLGPGVAEVGGLHVLGTERHEAIRIDRQLQGRAGRQGDPGSCQFFLSLEDELLEGLGPDKQESLREWGRSHLDADCQRFAPLFRKAQKRLERRYYRQRLDLMLHERQRQQILKDLGSDPYVD